MSAAAARVERVIAGDRRAMASLMRDLEDAASSPVESGRVPGERAARARQELAALYAQGAPDLLLGVTGPPGAGKSTLVDALVAAWRAAGKRVGVVAVDPTSPLSGGAILGDRFRMQRHATDEGVFIRSLASRGVLGGLSAAVLDVATVLAAGGFRSVVVETVGAGQSEVDVAALADVTVVVTVPGLGDELQTLKAGILELADVLVLNKADRPGAEQALAHLEAMLALRRAVPAGPGLAAGDVPIARTVATQGEGVPELIALIERLQQAGAARRPERRLVRARAAVESAVLTRTVQALKARLAGDPLAQRLIEDVAERRLDPDAAAAALIGPPAKG